MHGNESLPIAAKALGVPGTIEAMLEPVWLSAALAPVSGGAPVLSVELSEVIKSMASKARFTVRFANDPDRLHAFCLKAFLDEYSMGGSTTIREADFYTQIAPQLSMQLPAVPAVVLDRDRQQGVLIMEDLIAAGARFCSVLEPFSADLAAQSLDQLARLHARPSIAAALDWLPSRLDLIAEEPHFGAQRQQEFLDDGRCDGLPEQVRDAHPLLEGLKRLSARNRAKGSTVLHGDCHAGNVFLIDGLPGFTDWQLVQRGHWAVDVAYHIAAILPVETAEREERALLDHYLGCLRRHGGEAFDREEAWEDYRAGQLYGFYHWAITLTSEPRIIRLFMDRLGSGLLRHETYTLLGL